MERVRLDKKKEKWEKTHPKYASLPPNYSQDMNGKKKKKSKLYQVMVFPWWLCPESAPHYLWNL